MNPLAPSGANILEYHPSDLYTLDVKKRKPKKRLRSILNIKKDIWKLVSIYVRTRDQFCVTCNNGIAEHCGHYIHNGERNGQSGGNMLWWDLRNLNGQCVGCNKWKSGNLGVYSEFLVEKYGIATVHELRALYNTPKRYSRDELQQKLDWAKNLSIDNGFEKI